MTLLRHLISTLGRRLTLLDVSLLVLALNLAWLVILQAYGAHFRQVAGVPLLDLQNDLGPGRWITVTEVLRQIAGYGPEARALYWPFFILDNVMPLLAFGSFALLWAVLLKDKAAPLAIRLLRSPLFLIPLGVGLFDWLENLSYITAIYGERPGVAAVYAGLTFKWIKAVFLFLTFGLTWPLVGYHLWLSVRRRLQPGPVT